MQMEEARSGYFQNTVVECSPMSNESLRKPAVRWRARIYDGGPRSDAARLGNMMLLIIRDCVLRFNEHGPTVSSMARLPLNPRVT